ncbi:MAG: MBL fold metallo-hydrolase [Chitinophagaceae bacterium]
MSRRQFIRSSALTLGAVAFTRSELFASLLADPWKVTMLRNNVGIFTERGGTIGFYLSKDGIVVVDTQFPDQSKHLIGELRKQNQQPFRLLINTHHHGDHSSGNISFKGLAERVLAHSNSKANQERVAKEQKKEDQQLYPDRTYDTLWDEKVAGERVCLHYFGPAHTNGDSLVQFAHADIVHMGDLMFNRRHPFIDRSAGASVSNWIEVLNKTTKKFSKKTIYIFGHSLEPGKETGNAEDLKMFGDYLEKLLKFAESEFKAGKSKEEFIKNTAIPGVTEWKGDGIARPLTAAYEEVSLGKGS